MQEGRRRGPLGNGTDEGRRQVPSVLLRDESLMMAGIMRADGRSRDWRRNAMGCCFGTVVRRVRDIPAAARRTGDCDCGVGRLSRWILGLKSARGGCNVLCVR